MWTRTSGAASRLICSSLAVRSKGGGMSRYGILVTLRETFRPALIVKPVLFDPNVAHCDRNTALFSPSLLCCTFSGDVIFNSLLV